MVRQAPYELSSGSKQFLGQQLQSCGLWAFWLLLNGRSLEQFEVQEGRDLTGSHRLKEEHYTVVKTVLLKASSSTAVGKRSNPQRFKPHQAHQLQTPHEPCSTVLKVADVIKGKILTKAWVHQIHVCWQHHTHPVISLSRKRLASCGHRGGSLYFTQPKFTQHYCVPSTVLSTDVTKMDLTGAL